MKSRRLIFLEEDYNKMVNHLLKRDCNEWAAFGFVEKDQPDPFRIYIRKLMMIEKEQYENQSPGFNSLKPETQLELINRFIDSEESGLLEIHSHPFCDYADFSGVDNKFYQGFRSDLLKRKKNSFVARMVVGQKESGFCCFYSNEKEEEIAIEELNVIGRHHYRKIERAKSKHGHKKIDNPDLSWRYYRNRQVFGEKGQRSISNIKLGIVGAGGIMNPFVLLAKHVGFRNFTICDFDRIETINFNRLLGVRSLDIGILKTELLEREIKSYDESITVTSLNEKFQDTETQRTLLNCDIIISGIDNDESRVATQIFCAKHMLPMIDLGSGIYLNRDRTHIESKGSQMRFFIPGFSCLSCLGLDFKSVRSVNWLENRKSAGYIMDTNESPGSVITLNSRIASTGLSVLIDYVTGFNEVPLHICYNELDYSMKKPNFLQRDDCPVCGKDGIIGSGMDSSISEIEFDEKSEQETEKENVNEFTTEKFEVINDNEIKFN